MAIQGHSRSCFDVDEKPLGDYIMGHNNFGLIYEISKDTATTKSKNGNFRRQYSHLMPPIQRTPVNIGITPISSQTRVSALYFRHWQYGSIFIQILVMGSERQAHNVREQIIAFQLSKVIDFNTNRKRVYIFLLVVNSNLDPMLHRFRDTRLKCQKSTIFHTTLHFRLKFGVFPLEYFRGVGVFKEKKGYTNHA